MMQNTVAGMESHKTVEISSPIDGDDDKIYWIQCLSAPTQVRYKLDETEEVVNNEKPCSALSHSVGTNEDEISEIEPVASDRGGGDHTHREKTTTKRRLSASGMTLKSALTTIVTSKDYPNEQTQIGKPSEKPASQEGKRSKKPASASTTSVVKRGIKPEATSAATTSVGKRGIKPALAATTSVVKRGIKSASAATTSVTSKDNDAKGETEKEKPSKKPVFESMEDIVRRLIITSGRREDVARYRQLYIALVNYDWKEAEYFINKNPEALKVIISELSETIFHNIVESDQDGAIQLLQNCLSKVTEESVLEKVDSSGSTALFKAAIVGNIKTAKILVKCRKNLLTMRNNQKLLPVHYAGFSGHKETVQYLLSETQKSNENLKLFDGKSGFSLVQILIEANLYDIASALLKNDPDLTREKLSRRGTILRKLAGKPKGFLSGSQLGYWQRLIYDCIPVQEECIQDCPRQKQTNDAENPPQRSQNTSTKSSPFRFLCAWSQKLHVLLWKILKYRVSSIQAIHDKKLMHVHTVEIVRMMCAGVPWRFEDALKSLKMPILTAARLGIHEIVKEIIKTCPDSLIFVDEDGNNVLMLAISHRQEEVFKLASQFGVIKQMNGNNMKNNSGNNILHLAATSAPASEVPGAALQMQRELQWFKVVGNYVSSSLYEARNNSNKTPRQMFTEEHEKLMEKGEKLMKDNASSCTIAVSLIITVVFAATFTAPGGNDDKGMPNFLHKLPFIIFIISDALALFSSITLLMIFIGILTSSYSEEDFLVFLPRKLIFGLITMFFSIASMMVAFGATIYLVLSHPGKWVIIPIALFSCIPVTLFATLQFPLLARICSSTCKPTISQPMKNI